MNTLACQPAIAPSPMETAMINPVPPADGVFMIADLPAHERPRERLWRQGADALSDAELLAILLRTGARRRSAVDVARDLLARFDHRLEALAAAAPVELKAAPGVGAAKAVSVLAAFALARRLQATGQADRPHLGSPAEVANWLRETLRGKAQEEFHVLLLDSRHRLLRDVLATLGLADRSQAHAREVFREAIRENCTRIILAHNHPAGDPTPSPQDVECTRGLVAAGKVVGIEVLDHVVLGARTPAHPCDYTSLRTAGLM